MNILIDNFLYIFIVKAGFILNILYNQTILKNFYYIYAALFILFLIYFFSGIGALGVFVESLAIGVLIISWIFSSRLFKMIGGLFVAVGTIFTLTSGGNIGAIISNSISNLPLLMFFSLLPWIGTVVKVGGIDESITDMIQDRKNRVDKIYGSSVVKTFKYFSHLHHPADVE